MSHSTSLRLIGQTLDAAHVPTFELEKYGQDYMVWITLLSARAEKLIRNALHHSEAPNSNSKTQTLFCFSPAAIARLEVQARHQRRQQLSSSMPGTIFASHGLRTLGDFFDRVQIHAFRVEWNAKSIGIDYQRIDGQRNCKTFTSAELRYLCEQSMMQRQDSLEKLISF